LKNGGIHIEKGILIPVELKVVRLWLDGEFRFVCRLILLAGHHGEKEAK
jgi:hypothetical protein